MLQLNNNNSNNNNCCHHRQATRTLLVLVVLLLLGVDTTVAKGGSRGGSRGGGSRGSSSSFSSSGTSSTYTGSSSSFGSTGSSSSSFGSGSSNSKYGSSSSSGNNNIPMAAPATPVGSSSSSYGSGSSNSKYGSSSSSGNKNIPMAAPATPVRSYGGGYASSNSFNTMNTRNQNSRSSYPTNGYNNNLLYGVGGFYLGSSYRRNNYNNNNNNNEEDENYDQYFDRMENGCQLTGVESYRTIDNNNNNNNTSSPSIWTGCSEEWRYNVEVILNKATSSSIRVQNFTFVSPPIELYVCSENDSCASCQEELNGKNFDALTLEALNTQNGTYLIDCYVPKDLTTVNKTFDCINEECVFISERYTSSVSSSSSRTISSFWTTVVMTSGLAATLFYSMLG